MSQPSPRGVPAYVVALWSLAAILEGIDLQAAGIAGPGMAVEFHFRAAQMGWIFTAGTFGLVLGALIGGRLADRFGRKIILVVSVAVYGLFSVATARSWDLQSMLTFRVLTGLGLGGAIPNLIAIAAESTRLGNRNTIIGLMYCWMPLGSALAAAIGWIGMQGYGWRVVFYAGGIGPLLVAPLLAWAMPESPVFLARRALALKTSTPRTKTATVLFAEQRWSATLALWLSSFCTYFILYLLVNWLPSLLVKRGFSTHEAAGVMVFFNCGGAAGILCGGLLMDRLRTTRVILCIYTGQLLALLALTYAAGVTLIIAAAFAADLFVAASQMIQYCLVPRHYPLAGRGTAMGAMVGVGRSGSIAGPLTAGQLLAAGAAGGVVLAAGVPGLIISACILLATRRGEVRE